MNRSKHEYADADLAIEPGLLECKCKACGHASKNECVTNKCQCCDLEDMFSILARIEAFNVL